MSVMTKYRGDESACASRFVTSADGTVVSYFTVGNGPAAIVVPGVLSTATDYASFVEALGESHTVHTIERRGRGVSGPQGDGYGIAKECEDIAALQRETKATFLVGHSYGGLIALEAARNNPAFAKLAVYEPGVSVDGSIATAWMPAYKKSVAGKKYLDALVTFSIGAGPEQARKMPHWLMKLMLPMFLRKHERQKMYGLLAANLLEHQEVARNDGSYRNYRQVPARVLLMFGGKTRHKWVGQAITALSETLPSCEVREFPSLDHFGPDKGAPREVARAVSSFFSE